MSEKIISIPDRILRRAEVEARTGLARSTIYGMVSKGDFPKPIRLTPGSVGWVSSEIDDWLLSRALSRPFN